MGLFFYLGTVARLELVGVETREADAPVGRP